MFMVSNPDLVVACCTSGVVGTFPALNCRDNAGYCAWLNEIGDRLDRHAAATGIAPAPFGVNLSLRRGNPRLEQDLATTIANRVPLVITSLGISRDVVDQVHGYGGVLLHDVINLRHARKAAASGVDGLILVAAGAGGHGGRLNPFAFVAEVRRWFDGTVVLAGGISAGHQIAAARLLGADLVSIGTRFIATREANAPDRYKAMIVEAGSEDIVYTAAMTGVEANFLKASLHDWGIDPADLANAAIDSTTRTVRNDDREGKVWRDIWSAGQSVGAIDDIPAAAELCRRLAADHASARHVG
jgi:nitronate monooxygenase